MKVVKGVSVFSVCLLGRYLKRCDALEQASEYALGLTAEFSVTSKWMVDGFSFAFGRFSIWREKYDALGSILVRASISAREHHDQKQVGEGFIWHTRPHFGPSFEKLSIGRNMEA